MSETIVGIVEEVMDNGVGKGSGVRIGGSKYGVYDPADAGLDEVSVGTTISLNFTEKNAGGGIIYKNVKGRLTTVKDGTPVSAIAPVAATGGVSKGGFRKNGEEGGWPLHPRAYEMALDKRNATQVAASMGITDIKELLDIAGKIADFTSGADIEAAKSTLSPEDMMNSMLDEDV